MLSTNQCGIDGLEVFNSGAKTVAGTRFLEQVAEGDIEAGDAITQQAEDELERIRGEASALDMSEEEYLEILAELRAEEAREEQMDRALARAEEAAERDAQFDAELRAELEAIDREVEEMANDVRRNSESAYRELQKLRAMANTDISMAQQYLEERLVDD